MKKESIADSAGINKMPQGIKILFITSIVGLISFILNINTFFDEINLFGKFLLPMPYSMLYNLGALFINTGILISYYKRYSWGFYLNLYSLTFSIISILFLLIQSILSKDLDFVVISVYMFLLVFLSLIFNYIFKHKSYFNK